jgi:nucleoside-diphosphate-sugar epimerase
VAGDIADPRVLDQAIDAGTTSIFHLAAIVSGGAEADFDLGMRVNFDATRQLLEVCRHRGHRPRVVFTSSVAVFGGELPERVLETTALTPQSSYGAEKAMAELLVADYTRKGFVDGRSLRLPTVSVRPGRPNAALSSFASSIIREPLNGEPVICPVERDARVWILSPDRTVESLIRGHEIDSEAFGDRRSVNLPGLSVTVGEMVESLERLAGPDVVRLIRWEPDARIQRVVASWPGAFDTARAEALGFRGDEDMDSIIGAHQMRQT